MRLFRISLWFAAAIQVIHLLALPFVAMPVSGGDSNRITRTYLGQEILSEGGLTGVPFIPSPVYESLVQAGAWMSGGKVESILLTNALLAAVTVFCLARLVTRLSGVLSGVFVVIGLSLLPVFVAIQHVFSGEIATICLLSVVLLAAQNFFLSLRIPSLIFLLAAVSLGYYLHPALLSLGPCISILVVLLLFSKRSYDIARPLFLVSTAGLLTLLPLLFSFPWSEFRGFGVRTPALVSGSEGSEDLLPIRFLKKADPRAESRELLTLVFEPAVSDQVGSGFERFERQFFFLSSSAGLIVLLNGLSAVLLFFALLRKNPELALLPGGIVVLYLPVLLGGSGTNGLLIPAQILLFAGAILFLGRALGWMFFPVFSKDHPLTNRHERIREVIATRLLEDALEERRGASFPRRANRR